jgi:hypothetical protein
MPLPLGHTAIGLTTYELSANDSPFRRWKRFLYITILANLPDIDVVIGLVLTWNGNAFHRGPTHSLAFALLMGLLAGTAARGCLKIPGISFRHCFLLIFSHVIADALLTSSRVSFFWPFQVNWSAGYAGWTDVMHSILFEGLKDGWIVLSCATVIIFHRLISGYLNQIRVLSNMRKGSGPTL